MKQVKTMATPPERGVVTVWLDLLLGVSRVNLAL